MTAGMGGSTSRTDQIQGGDMTKKELVKLIREEIARHTEQEYKQKRRPLEAFEKAMRDAGFRNLGDDEFGRHYWGPRHSQKKS
jgi:hypothetical protein